MACKRSAVRSRLAPPEFSTSSRSLVGLQSPSSRGLGHHPFTVRTGVRIPVGTPMQLRACGAAVERHVPFQAVAVRSRGSIWRMARFVSAERSAVRRSYIDCKFSQNCAVPPK
jgi:hypothetical protein